MDLQYGLYSYKSKSPPTAAMRCINGYPEFQPTDAKKRIIVKGSPGVRPFLNIGHGPMRGIMEMNGVGYCVSGTQFFSFAADGTSIILGSGITGFAPVSMAGNGFEIVIVNGVNGFSYLLSDNSFIQISDGDFHAANSVCNINNVFVFDWAGTNKFFCSNVLDGRSYDGLNFASAESDSDNILSVANRNGVLILFGERTIESWDHTGAAAFPFQRFKGGTIDRGIEAPSAHESEDEALFFLGDDLTFYRLNGLSLQRVSNHALETEWGEYATTSDAFCFRVSDGGHKFIYLTFPTEGRTFGMDIASQNLWHERMSWDATGREVKWRANTAATIYNKTMIGDANGGRLGHLDANIYTEFGDPIVTTLVGSPIHADGRRVFMPCLEVDFEGGVGLTTGQGSDPQLMMQISDDGGHTWESPELWTSIGRIGEYRTTMRWDRLGSFFQRSIRLSISDPIRRTFIAVRAPKTRAGAE